MKKVSRKYFNSLNLFNDINDYFDETAENYVDSKRHDEIMSLLNGYKFHLQLHCDGRGWYNNEVTSERYEWDKIPFIAFASLLRDLRSEKLAL